MGDGKVALILDVLGLAQRASVVNEVRDHAVVKMEGLCLTNGGLHHLDC